MPKDFQTIKATASGIEGMLSPFSMALLDCVLSFQEENRITGNIVELGVFRGKSAAILAGHIQAPERLVLVDPVDQVDRKPLATVLPGFEFIECPSERFGRTAVYREVRRQCRFVHIDTSHAYRATFNELKLADGLLQGRGVICLDDYTNLNFSQILAATYKYLFTAWTQLTVFLVTNEKAYLCRKQDFDFYARYVLDHAIDQMAQRDMKNLMIARTDTDPEYRAIYLRPPLPGESGRQYGPEIYGRFYERP